MKTRNWTDEDFRTAVKESSSYAEVIRHLGLIPAGGNYITVKNKIRELNLDISHMTGQLWSKGKILSSPKYHKGVPLKDILIRNSKYINFYKLKNRILNEGLKERKCECCGMTQWLGHDIPLEIHHINGIKNDLRITNIQILCPNCRTLTVNYRGKNIRMQSARKETSEVEAG